MKKSCVLILALLTANSASVEQDKIMHMTGSAVISGTVYALADEHKTIKALSVCMTVGLAKELYDEYSYSGFDEKDLVADGIGCLLGAFVSSKTFSVKASDGAMSINYNYKF